MNTSEDLKGLNPNGSTPESRLNDPDEVRRMVSKAVTDNNKRAQRNALVKGLVDGNPPVNQSSLDKTAQRFRANFNNGEAESYLDVSKTAYYDLFAETPTYATVITEAGSPEMAVEWSEILTDEFDRLQRQDDCMDYGIQLSQHDMVLYGSGPHFWEDLYDWRSKPVKHSNVLLPISAKSDVYEWKWCAIRCQYQADDLYRYIANPELAKEYGYDVKAIRKAIVDASDRRMTGWVQDWEWHQQRIRNNDLSYGETANTIAVSRVLYKEFAKKGEYDGKISECWILEDDTGSPFLFRRLRCYDNWKQAVCQFFYDKGDGTAHSVKGLGVKMYKMLLTKMRLQNATVDAAFARTAIMFKAATPNAANTASLVHLGPYTMMKNGLEYVNTTIGGILDAPIAVSRELDNTLSTNLSQYRARGEKPTGNPRTKFEVEATLQQQSSINKTQISRYYNQLDDWYAERFRRASNPKLVKGMAGADLALEFQGRVNARGIPLEVLQKCTVTATRNIGQGSQILRIQMIDNILGTVGPALPETGRANLIADSIAAKAGFHAVERYFPESMRPEVPDDHTAWAMVENDSLKEGSPVQITPTQNNVIHATVHLNAAAQAAASLQQGADPAKVFMFLNGIGAHAFVHIKKAQADPFTKDAGDKLFAQWQRLAALADKLKQKMEQQMEAQQEAAQKQQQAQAVAQGTDPDTMLKAAEVQAKIGMQGTKNKAALQQKAQKHAQSMALADASTADAIRRTNAMTDAKLEQQRRESSESNKD